MAQFNDLKDELDFIEATTPVIALTLKPELLEGYKNEPKEAKAKKLKAKTWKEFDAVLMKDFPNKGYEMIEGTNSIDGDGDSDPDPIQSADKYVLIPKSSFAYVSDLSEKFKNDLLAGVRSLDTDGNTMVIPNINDLFDSDINVTTDLYGALEDYETVYNGLLKYAESIEDSTNPEVEEIQVDENQVIDEEPEPLNESEVEKLEDGTIKEELESNDEPEVSAVNQPQAYVAEQVENADVESTLETNLIEKIKEKFQKMELEQIDTIGDSSEDLDSVSELKPVLYLAKESINARINIANKKIEGSLTEKIETLSTKAKTLLTEELQRIEEATSLDEENNYTKALKDAEETLKAEHGKIEGAVLQHSSILKQNFERDKKAFVEKEIARLEREYDEKHLPELQEAENNFRKESEDKLNTEYQNAVVSIKDQATGQREKAQSSAVDRLMSLMEKDIIENLEDYQKSALEIVDKTKADNEAELKETKEKTTDILVQHYANKKEVESKVEKLTDSLTNDLESTKLEVEHYKREFGASEKQLKTATENNTKLQQQADSLRQDLTRTREDLAKVLDSKKVSEALEETGSKKSGDYSTKKMATFITIAGMACGTLLGATYFATHGSNNSSAQAQTAVTQTIESSAKSTTKSSSTEDKKDVEKDSSYEAEPTTEFKIGQEVPILVEGKTQTAKVDKIEGQYAVVKTADGNQFRIKAMAGNE
ncbi:MAG: hypothetical protein ACLTPR_13545 [Enterococcus canintestini]|uniref:hypothetical protein n=1 Tax=Enterococcus canintestini TaxID=317010 RepID=UPI0039924252